jgi:zinc transport system substrate-binding protein
VVDLSTGLPLRAPEEHADESAEEHAAHGTTDPHVWLDPVLMGDMAQSVTDTLAQIDPENAQQYRDNAAALEAELDALDTDWRDGTDECAIRTMVVSHEAFGYLAARYGFEQKGIAGLTPETEPSAAAIADLTRFVQENGITTVYTETLVDPAVAQTVADEAGAQTATLDPLEGPPASGDYLTAMRQNLDTVRPGQSCT